MKSKYYVIIVVLFYICCKTNKTTELKKMNDTGPVFETKTIEEKLINDNKTLMLILNYEQTMDLPLKIDYSVIKLSSKKVIKTGTFTGIKMEWSDLYNIKGYLYQGMIKKQDDVINEKNINKSNENFIIINLEKESK